MVGVVGGRRRQLRLPDAVTQRHAPGQAVDDGWVGGQGNALHQPVDEHRRHARPLVWERGLLLHDRGQGHGFLGGPKRQPRPAVRPEAGQQAFAGGDHPVQHDVAIGPALDLIGLGQQRTLGRRRDLAGQHRVGRQDSGRLGGGQALRDGHEMADDPALAEPLYHLG